MDAAVLKVIRDKFSACFNFIAERSHTEEEIESYIGGMYPYKVSIGEMKGLLMQIKEIHWAGADGK